MAISTLPETVQMRKGDAGFPIEQKCFSSSKVIAPSGGGKKL